MTDVSNLDDLARAISTGSPKIRNYAIAQASATQSQEVDIQAALSQPPPPPPAGGAGGYWAIIEPGQDVQAIINSAPSGALIGIRGRHVVPSGRSVLCDLSSKGSIRLEGLGSPGYNSPAGAIFETSGQGQTLIREASQGGPKFESQDTRDITFVDNHGGGKAIDVFNVNHWRVRNCTFNGKFNGGCIIAKQFLDGRLTSDNAWSHIENCRWRTEGPAVLADFAGLKIFGGAITGYAGSGIYLLSNSGALCYGLETAFPGTHLTIEGGNSRFFACTFEQYEKATNNVPIIKIAKPAQNPWPMSGNNNTIIGCNLVPHEWSTTGPHVYVGPGCYTNKLDLVIVAQTPNVQDQGIGTIKEIRG